jgi:DNA-binding NarL/FixJ family response regulator
MSLRVAVADDAVLFREGLARLLADAGFQVTAAVGTADALLGQVAADPPDVALVDIRMPPTHTTEGLEAARTLRTRHPGVGVLVLSAHVETAYALVVDPSVVAALVGRRRVQSPLDALSERERDVLTVMAEGRSNQAIGERLFLSPKTVEAYVRAVFTKLGLYQAADDNRRVLAVLAFLRG